MEIQIVARTIICFLSFTAKLKSDSLDTNKTPQIQMRNEYEKKNYKEINITLFFVSQHFACYSQNIGHCVLQQPIQKKSKKKKKKFASNVHTVLQK